jgi:hypothetical protein
LGLDVQVAAETAKWVASGDVTGAVGKLSPELQTYIFAAASAAFANGFAVASLVAAVVAAIAGLLAVFLLRRGEEELTRLGKVDAMFIAAAE